MSALPPPATADLSVIETEMRQWLERAVIGLNLCPFAKSVYIKNQVRFVVSRAIHLDALLEELDRELDLLAETDPADVDTTLLIHPWVFQDFMDFNDLLEITDQVLLEHQLEGELQIAAFHPEFQFADTEPDDVGNYSNRAPYPTLHLLREASIDRAVAAFPEAEAIYLRNIETLQKLGHEGFAKVLRGDGTAEDE
ncbi:DUF1415 domain-containing protein [Parachitinimonas caeni]|uniref:DUF1415 domain-containing protein n=1 Tax=Parachitinimonas caeni TaxID=3031301 RepID=A0ABT7DTZ9_9NEIS|nr:DUF1415 domain-containing protein [Parachitinimonas caeni]MDK2123449.1 DUF1415 domain-containing protein [Parachitinimonas caeni]